MRRRAVHLFAAIAESLRFIAVLFLAFDLGALFDARITNLVRYAAAPQLLFAAGFFFLWLDPARYGSYRPLLLIGKAASAVCLLPLAAGLVRDPKAVQAALALFVAAVDIVSLSILIVARPLVASDEPPAGQGPSGSLNPGQGPGDIEQVEGF